MAMATFTQLLSSHFFHSQFTKKPFLLPAATTRGHGFFSSRSPKSLSLSCRPSVSASAASSAVGVNESLTSEKSTKTLPFRVGHGFDLHRLEPGYPLIIGGIDIPHDRGCEAHSDGDVLLHCVVDAILGALGLPDIGQIFPDSDPKWKGAASSVFIKEADLFDLDDFHDALDDGKLLLDMYLEEPKLEMKLFPDMCVLQYWKENRHRFGVLSYMAYDILSIPITTLASESSFSIESRILNKYRTRLLPMHVQALLCTRSWLFGFKYDEKEGEKEEDDANNLEAPQEEDTCVL